jgi:hypothetical protein
MTDVILMAMFRQQRHYLGKWFGFKFMEAKRKFMRKAWPYRCSWCDQIAYRGDRTVDHIVPRWLCLALGLPWLVIDQANFQVMHNKCNNQKGGRVTPEALELLAQKVNYYLSVRYLGGQDDLQRYNSQTGSGEPTILHRDPVYV